MRGKAAVVFADPKRFEIRRKPERARNKSAP